MPFHLLILDAGTDIQASLLSFVGQQAIAHAATIFATLTAAFTFAVVQRKPVVGNRRTFCVLILSLLLAGGIYAGLRLYYYGVLSGIVLNCSVSPNQTWTQYWNNVTFLLGQSGEPSTWLFAYLGVGPTIPSFSISYVIGFVLAVGVTSYSIDDSNEGWRGTFDALPPWSKFVLYWAGLNYVLGISLGRFLGHIGLADLPLIIIPLFLAGISSLTLTIVFHRKKTRT
jgi:hypothetical protein